jgi:hypothetical protein
MKLIISTLKKGKYFCYRVEIQGLCLWDSQNFYHKRRDALSSAFLDAWSVLIDCIFFTPSGLFDLKTGVILATNYDHRRWLGRDCVGCHHSEVLCDFRVNSRIVPAGTRALGLYEVKTAERCGFKTSDRTIN